MSSVLQEICARKAEHVAVQKAKISLGELEQRAKAQEAPRGFINALKMAEFPAIIAEVKKASPSKGLIRADFDPATIAQTYEDNGAACISVLTDEPYFQGHDDYFTAVKAAVKLPMLRKDFMIDPYQITESRALGADCILIIMAALSDNQAAELFATATELGMDSLIEVHDKEELERAANLNPAMIGVNNRNLKTLEVSVQTSIDLAQYFPADTLAVAESGLGDFATLETLKTHSYSTFLVGESLMRQADIGAALRSLRGQQ